jgi:hypothetical protein
MLRAIWVSDLIYVVLAESKKGLFAGPSSHQNYVVIHYRQYLEPACSVVEFSTSMSLNFTLDGYG